MRRIVPLIALIVCGACGSDPPPATPTNIDPEPDAAPPDRTPPPAGSDAPTYTELYARYFAPGTPGHCATSHCHADPGFNVWLCGDSKASCYEGMVSVGLIDTENPLLSLIGNPDQSPLSWVSPTGDMPFDATGPFPEGRDAIIAWVKAGAQND
jgi:hypothetical protein